MQPFLTAFINYRVKLYIIAKIRQSKKGPGPI